MAACVAMIQRLAKSPIIPPTSATLDPLKDDIIYHMVEQTGGTIVFSDINDQTVECSAIVAQPYMDNLLNIYSSTAVVFQHYERLLDSFFSKSSMSNYAI